MTCPTRIPGTTIPSSGRSFGNLCGMRPAAWRAIAAAAALAALLAKPSPGIEAMQSPPQARPNILLIQADDLGYGDLSAYGQARFTTPSIDRLAREGTRFTQYYAGSTVCAPSRAALLTGLHTGHTEVRGNSCAPDAGPQHVTVASLLRAAGYRTAVIGKWGLGGPGTSGQPDRQGFDYSFGFLDHRHAHRQYTDHLYRNAKRVAVDLERDYVNDLFTREAESFIGATDARPFFLYLNYTVPHAEVRVPEDSLAPLRGTFPETPFVNAKADAVARARPSTDRRSATARSRRRTPRSSR